MSWSMTFWHVHFQASDIVALLSVVLCVVCIQALYSKSALPLPPGPKQLPIIGNFHQISNDQTVTFVEWHQEYGDIVYARLFRRPLIIINSLRTAQDLLNKRGSIYSDRPHFVPLTEIYGFRPTTGFLSSGEEWRRQRKWLQAALETKTILDGYGPLQRKEVDRLLMDLMQAPKMFISHIKRFSGALMLEIAYGHNVTTVQDDYIRMADNAFTSIVEGGSLVASLLDLFPILKFIPTWMPGGGFKRRGLEVRKLVRQMMDDPFESVRKAMASGSAKPSFLSSLIEELSSDGYLKAEDALSVRGAASQLYNAGSDTTAATLSTFILAMTLHPRVFRKAQEEIDRVIGTERLVELRDKDTLPYLECLLKEVYRWHPVTPLGIPHRLTAGDQYRGYSVPGGSTVVANLWSMSRDPSIYPEPEEFRPERYEGMDAETAKLTDPRKFVFGFGRRVCPGRHLAELSIWLAVANILATLNIRKSRDVAGREITPSISYTTGFASHSEEFPCDIWPRTSILTDSAAHSG